MDQFLGVNKCTAAYTPQFLRRCPYVEVVEGADEKQS